MRESDPDLAPPRPLASDSAASIFERSLREQFKRYEHTEKAGQLWLDLGLTLATQQRDVEARSALLHAAGDRDLKVSIRALAQLVRLNAERPVLLTLLDRIASEISADSDPAVVVDLAQLSVACDQPAQAVRVLELMRSRAPEPAPASQEAGDSRRAHAVAALRLAELRKSEGAPDDVIDQLYEEAVEANDLSVTPVAALALAERRIHREPCGHGIDDLLRTAWVYDYPLVSSIAARHLAEIYTTRKQFDWASEMLDWLVERGDPELTDWASNRRRALQTQARELGTDDLARSLAWRVQKTIRTRRPGAELHPMRTLIVGAGSGARRLLQDLNMKRVAVIGLIDDYVAGSVGDHKVLGRIDELPDLLRGRHVDQVLLAVPSASPDLAYNVGMVCAQAGVRLRVLPNPFELLADRRYGRQLRRLRVEETYGDGPVTVDPTAGDCVRARSVLIIGAGAIGSELARQVVVARPRHLALFDSSEAALESVTSELKEARRFKWTFAQLGDIANRNEIRDSMELHKPEIVFVVSGVNHAHLAEQNLVHAARVNVLGPWIAAQEAVRAGVERMILVSSDNAAQRHSSFDLTKAIAERVVCNLDCDSTCIAAVRLANVWRTPGTVVNRFERQIDYGGPVTLTGSGMTRRFLTRHAAAYWLLRVAAMAEPGAIYAVDAGVEVSIAELAERLIKLRGWEPGRDIKIADRGTRVGEKLSTQLWGADEPLQTTAIEQVVKVTSRPLEPALANEYLSRIEQRGDAEPEFVEKLLRAADTLCGQTQEGQRLLQAGQT